MKNLLLLVFLSFSTLSVSAQGGRIQIKGIVTDSADQALEAGTIVLLKAKDSSLVSFTRTNDQGAFELKNIKPDEPYLLKITYLGYADFQTTVSPGDGQNILDLGRIRMAASSKTLSEVVVQEQHIPVQIKKDTIEFNSAAFRTLPNANVEDMIKKMPGMEVDKEGNISAQGKTVTQVLVDGKKFFGKDPKIATRNLPAEAVDKVQVFDKKSDAAEFSGIDDGERETTINLKLKSNARKGTFGSMSAAAGTGGRFDSRASINKFDGQRQLSFIGMGNNLNQQGFSIGDYLSFSGDAQRMVGGGGGGGRMQVSFNTEDQAIPLDFGGTRRGTGNAWAGGLHFNQNFGKNTEINSSYFYNFSKTFINRVTDRENFLPSGNYNDLSRTEQNSDRQTHRLTIQVDQLIDTFSSIRFNGNFSFNDNYQDHQSLTQQRVASETINEVDRYNASESNALNLQGTLLYRLKFPRRGRFFSTTLSLNTNDNNTDADNRTIRNYLTGSAPILTDSIFQQNLRIHDRRIYSAGISFTEPVARRRYFEFNASHRSANTNYNQEVYDLLFGKTIDETLSNGYKNTYSYNRAGFNFRIAEKEINVTTGLTLQQSKLNGLQEQGENKRIRKDFLNLLPSARLEYDLGSGANLSFNYNANVREPSIEQISPIIDNSNPQYVTLGNPDLRPEYNHNLNLNFRKFNMASFTNFFAFARMTLSRNPIIYSQVVDQYLTTTSKPVNLDKNNLSLSGNLNYGFQVKPVKTRINLSTGYNGSRGFNFIQQAENKYNTHSLNGRVNVEYRPGDAFEFVTGVRRAWNNTVYSINRELNQKSHTTTYNADLQAQYKGFTFSTGLNYFVYKGLSDQFNQQVPIWSASFSKTFLKNKRLELKLTANDILKQNIGINRVSQLNYIEDEEVNTLSRYFLMGIHYTLKGTPSMGGGRRMIRMMN
ncbi:MAG TPA: TonB-dependent receptor [Saprospiraceae bacterium]|nr:TonB-dependent receptor [Saprospiraceae bacterium]HNT19713.1 TonB-dependent receptor [Saprospiraceae bacterium]